jgi:hypothetical protein
MAHENDLRGFGGCDPEVGTEPTDLERLLESKQFRIKPNIEQILSQS